MGMTYGASQRAGTSGQSLTILNYCLNESAYWGLIDCFVRVASTLTNRPYSVSM